MSTSRAQLIFPHQLFIDHFSADNSTIMILVEDDLFFRQYRFHKQKLILHRASMQYFADQLRVKGFDVIYIESSERPSMEALQSILLDRDTNEISYYNLTDDWLEQRVNRLVASHSVKVAELDSPGFLTSTRLIEDYFNRRPRRMAAFYQWQRSRLNILMDRDKPVGGKWSYDADNRKKLPKNLSIPSQYTFTENEYVESAREWVQLMFPDNPGSQQSFRYPVTHDDASVWLNEFLEKRFSNFGPYEDAISSQHTELFHSKLSALLNIGLLTPRQVLDAVLDYSKKHDIPLQSLEGFVRQLIGWREYMRATYVQYGRKMRTQNHLQFTRQLPKKWWTADVGLEPIDTVIKSVLDTAYSHHIERLMILGNAMVLMRIDPDEAYLWFMEMFIDAYDWVMVPNVYAMSQFAAGELITTKPYVSGSNYIIKMSDYTKDEWSEVWDALFWQFVHDHRQIFERNQRSNMMVKLYDRMSDDKKAAIADRAQDWLNR